LSLACRVEDERTAVDLAGPPVGPPWDAVDFDADPEWEWRTAADDLVGEDPPQP
jgi:hypothetical protein